MYQLKYDPENRMASSLDGRQWQKYYESRRKDFDGLRRLAKCKGSRKCVNDQCSYLREFGERNRHHFKRNKCNHCKITGEFILCDARKVWEFSYDVVTIYHHGYHSCVCKPQVQKKVCDNIIKTFQDDPKMKPCQLASRTLCKAIDEGKWDKLDEISGNLIDVQHTTNLKKKALKELQPHGHSLGKNTF